MYKGCFIAFVSVGLTVWLNHVSHQFVETCVIKYLLLKDKYILFIVCFI